MCESECALCCSCDKLVTCLGFTPPSPNDSWDRFEHPRDPRAGVLELVLNKTTRYKIQYQHLTNMY